MPISLILVLLTIAGLGIVCFMKDRNHKGRKTDFVDVFCYTFWFLVVLSLSFALLDTLAINGRLKGQNSENLWKIRDLETQIVKLENNIRELANKTEEVEMEKEQLVRNNYELETKNNKYYEEWKGLENNLKEWENQIQQFTIQLKNIQDTHPTAK